LSWNELIIIKFDCHPYQVYQIEEIIDGEYNYACGECADKMSLQ
jgi:hypothetical protein